ncbi:CDP-glycerol glycerophosphotransferase family protein [Lactiplantibacillus plantarum]|uniref:CDP-glycerol glycerophosphotransferase family protein n=1 Tax=Lactiplantibacillus plantarum TaxID=1590 RepID=UPI001F296967|nr:CDP-glycerol glycerophosphotransferase family protein [Lactiplantibacillus plantarum]MCF1426227.1 CDP-glycerol glycerophosphotransferase family protein [Lactiplantibacillus plantarum]
MKIVELYLKNILFFLSGLFHRDSNIFIFGAWFGDRLSDNSKYYLNHVLEEHYKDNNMKLYWVGNAQLKEQVQKNYGDKVSFLQRNNIRTYLLILRAKYIFVSHGYLDVGSVNLSRNSVMIQFWHGFPLKKIGADAPENSQEGIHYYQRYSYYISQSRTNTKRLLTGFKNYGINLNKIIEVGYPRNYYLLQQKTKSVISFRKKFKIPAENLIVLYLPTFRDSNASTFSFSQLGDKEQGLLKRNHISILERHHFADATKAVKSDSSNIIEVKENIETQDLLCYADILITDYSSVYVDFALLNRPIIHYLYDEEYYLNNDRGLYTKNFQEEVGGQIVHNLDELLDSLITKKYSLSKYSDKRSEINKRFSEYCFSKDITEIDRLIWSK